MPRPFKRKRSKFDDVRSQRRKECGDEARQNVKRRRVEHQRHADGGQDSGDGDFTPLESGSQEPLAEDNSEFYGFLTQDEQAYYATVNTKITANDFDNDEDRENFIKAVHRESSGKELKLASSQSCSRYLERIILVSTPEQLLALLEKLSEGLTHLAQHRFGSHVLETLLAESVEYVRVPEKKRDSQDKTSSAFEACIIRAAKELEPNIGYLLTDRFGSHVVRSLVLVLSGEPLRDVSMQKILASKKKERVDTLARNSQVIEQSHPVPKTFQTALSCLTAAAVSNLDSTSLRALATHPTGNPVLQLLLKLDLNSPDKGRNIGEDSLFQKLLAPDSFESDSEGVKLVAGLTYDPTGSHLIETVVEYAPGKTFKKLYKTVWKPRLASMAKHDAASYVVVKILRRIGKDDLAEARDTVLSVLSSLLENRRFIVIQTLVERCTTRGIDLEGVAEAFRASPGKRDGSVLQSLLHLGASAETNAGADAADLTQEVRSDMHGSLLAQSLLEAPSVNILIQDSILATGLNSIILMAKDPSASRVLQAALTSSASSSAFRKQLVPKFYNHLKDLATSASGSYLVESLWDGTSGLHFVKERVASELWRHESELRESPFGRNVWRHWLMDLYIRRRGEWQARAKGQDVEQTVPEREGKSAIQIARERYAAGRQVRETRGGVRPDGSLMANS